MSFDSRNTAYYGLLYLIQTFGKGASIKLTTNLKPHPSGPKGSKKILEVEIYTSNCKLNPDQIEFLVSGSFVGSGGGVFVMFQVRRKVIKAHVSFAITALIAKLYKGSVTYSMDGVVLTILLNLEVNCAETSPPLDKIFWSNTLSTFNTKIKDMKAKSHGISKRRNPFEAAVEAAAQKIDKGRSKRFSGVTHDGVAEERQKIFQSNADSLYINPSPAVRKPATKEEGSDSWKDTSKIGESKQHDESDLKTFLSNMLSSQVDQHRKPPFEKYDKPKKPRPKSAVEGSTSSLTKHGGYLSVSGSRVWIFLMNSARICSVFKGSKQKTKTISKTVFKGRKYQANHCDYLLAVIRNT